MNIWQILEIEETKDEKIIKMAYARLVGIYHPEEFPEEFQKVQQAYNHAIAYAKGNINTYYMTPVEAASYNTSTKQEEKSNSNEEDKPIMVDDDEKEDRQMEFNTKKVDAIIDLINFYIVEKRPIKEWERLFLNEHFYGYTDNAYFIKEFALLLQLQQQNMTPKYLEVIKKVFENSDPRFIAKPLIRVLKALAMMFSYHGSDKQKENKFYEILLNTKETKSIEMYIQHIHQQWRKPISDSTFLVLQYCDEFLYNKDEKRLMTFISSEMFISASKDTYFIEAFIRLVRYHKILGFTLSKSNRLKILEVFRIQEETKRDNYILLLLNQTLGIKERNPKKEKRKRTIRYLIVGISIIIVAFVFFKANESIDDKKERMDSTVLSIAELENLKPIIEENMNYYLDEISDYLYDMHPEGFIIDSGLRFEDNVGTIRCIVEDQRVMFYGEEEIVDYMMEVEIKLDKDGNIVEIDNEILTRPFG